MHVRPALSLLGLLLILPLAAAAQTPTTNPVTTPPPAFATNTPVPLTTSPISPAGEVLVSLPETIRLAGLSPVYQQINRCAAAALTIALSYYDWTGDYTRTINGLNTYADDVAVRLDEMVAFVAAEGLRAIERTGGTIDLLRLLIASGYPVLVENSYFEAAGFNYWMGHNRVVMGYDDATQTFYTFDSLLGNGPDNTGRPMTYADLDDKWRAFNRGYLVVYRPEQEAELFALLGTQADRAANWEHTRQQAAAEIEMLGDGFAYFNYGTALTALGEYAAAAAAFDHAFSVRLPWRMLWYQYGPFEAYYQLGRYDDVLRLAADVRRNTGGVEETFYYAGRAYEALGNFDRAREYYTIASARNRHYAAPVAALARLDSAAEDASASGG